MVSPSLKFRHENCFVLIQQNMQQLLNKIALLEKENALLRERNSLLEKQVAGLMKENALLKEEMAKRDRRIEALEVRIDYLCRQLYGVKSEKFSADQLTLLLGEVAVVPAPPPVTITVERKLTAKGQGRIRLPQNLPREEVVLTPPEVLAAPEQWTQVGEDVTETLDYQPGHLFQRVYRRGKYIRKKDRCFIQAPMPPRPIEKCMAEAGLLSQIILDKYDRHLPLYRQGQYWQLTQDVFIPRSLISDWSGHAADLLAPVSRGIWQELLVGGYLQADETPIDYQDPDIKGKCGQGYFWLYGKPGGNVWIQWRTSRGREGPQSVLKDFQGKLQTDGYTVYEGLCRHRPDLEHVGCWAHARRKFFEAQSQDPVWAAVVLTLIGQLYEIEQSIKGSAPEERKQARQGALPVLEKLYHHLKTASLLPSSALGLATAYTLHRWKELTRYVQDGILEIDNNLLENTIRPTAVGKKNWLFIGAPEAGEKSAIIYSVILTCRRLGANPYAYIRDYLSQVATMKANQALQWTPAQWLARQNKTAPAPTPVAA